MPKMLENYQNVHEFYFLNVDCWKPDNTWCAKNADESCWTKGNFLAQNWKQAWNWQESDLWKNFCMIRQFYGSKLRVDLNWFFLKRVNHNYIFETIKSRPGDLWSYQIALCKCSLHPLFGHPYQKLHFKGPSCQSFFMVELTGNLGELGCFSKSISSIRLEGSNNLDSIFNGVVID